MSVNIIGRGSGRSAVGAAAVREGPEPTQATTPQTEQAKIVAELLELRNQEKALGRQLAASQKTLTAGQIQTLEQARNQKRREYEEQFAQAARRPDKDEIVRLWEEAQKAEFKRIAEARGKTETPAQTK